MVRAVRTSASVTTTSIEVQLFASRVETLGADNYPNSFAGATLTSAGITEVYAILASDAQLVRAINAINTAGYPVEIIGVGRSYNELNTTNAVLTAASGRLREEGIEVTQSWPDPAAGAVMVSIAEPNNSDIAALTSVKGTRVTASDYMDTVSGLLKSEFGQGVTLQSQYSRMWFASGRNNDTAPFYDGDRIYRSNVSCTGGFNMLGNRSGHVFMLTAGHCLSGTWRTGAQTVGSTSTNYLSGSSTHDYQTIYAPGGGLGVVWGNSGALYPVTNQLLPAVGAAITFDGSVTGEVRGNTVNAVNASVYAYNGINNTYYTAYPVVEATNPNGTWICQSGDSGGPVYSHTPSSDVWAVGTISAFYPAYPNAPGGATCAAAQIGDEESVTNTSLITSSPLSSWRAEH
jgi:hypothetical protein